MAVDVPNKNISETLTSIVAGFIKRDDREVDFKCVTTDGVLPETPENKDIPYADKMNGLTTMVIVMRKGKVLSEEERESISNLLNKLVENPK